jgi:ABC-type multidrug transport system fused ATPase/permease subunit
MLDDTIVEELVSALLEPETIITANDALSMYENDDQLMLEEQQLQSTIFKLIGYFSKKSKPKDKKKKKFKSVYTNVALFRQPDQPGSLSKSKTLQNGKEKIIQMIGGLDKFHLKEFLFTFAIRRLSKEELSHIAERCHYVVSEKITEIINEYYNRKILDCDNVYELDEMLDSEHKSLVKVVDYIDRNNENKDNFFLADQSFSDTSYSQLNKKFFFHEIIEFHRVSMAFLSTDNHTGKEHELFIRLRSCLEGILLKFPKWKTATRLIRYVYDTLSEHTYQCNRHLYNVRDLNNWGRGEMAPDSDTTGICITKENFEQFFQQILRFRKCQLSDFAEQPLDLNYLNRVLADKLADRLVAFENEKKLMAGKNLIFVLGHRGAGKSTLIQYLLGNESKMRITSNDRCA